MTGRLWLSKSFGSIKRSNSACQLLLPTALLVRLTRPLTCATYTTAMGSSCTEVPCPQQQHGGSSLVSRQLRFSSETLPSSTFSCCKLVTFLKCGNQPQVRLIGCYLTHFCLVMKSTPHHKPCSEGNLGL